MARVQTLHKALSEEMAKEVSHLVESGIAGVVSGSTQSDLVAS
jgi:hypothetical protein